jgi:hypothetical protein
MSKSSPEQPHDGSPSAAEIFRLFRDTTLASVAGLKLLLDECAGLRADLVMIYDGSGNDDGDGVFSARQQQRIVELKEAAQEMEAVLTSLPGEDWAS